MSHNARSLLPCFVYLVAIHFDMLFSSAFAPGKHNFVRRRGMSACKFPRHAFFASFGEALAYIVYTIVNLIQSRIGRHYCCCTYYFRCKCCRFFHCHHCHHHHQCDVVRRCLMWCSIQRARVGVLPSRHHHAYHTIHHHQHTCITCSAFPQTL